VERNKRVSSLLDRVGIGGERRLQLRKFSKGMLQRVGIAQAMLNDPEIVFLDEPMSGLDPLGRRDVRNLIIQLRDRGCTVFFSSHILADAEALCSRVAILAQGRLVAEGRVSEIVAFEHRGWELVVANVSESVMPWLAGRVRSMTPLPDARYMLELPPAESPARLIQELSAHDVRLVSLNPVQTTLEEFFVSKVGAAAPRDTEFLKDPS
jgi:ABC-2 type transport system ATP-binding protein